MADLSREVVLKYFHDVGRAFAFTADEVTYRLKNIDGIQEALSRLVAEGELVFDLGHYSLPAAASLPVREPDGRDFRLEGSRSLGALDRIRAWSHWWKSESRSQMRTTMRLIHEEAVAALDALPSEPDAEAIRRELLGGEIELLREGMAELGYIVGRNPDGVDDTAAATLLVVRELKAALPSEPAHYPTREGPGFGDWRCACGGRWGTEADLRTHLRRVPSVREEPGE